MRRNLLTIGLCLFCTFCHAWELGSPVGGRSSAVGDCSVALRGFWSIHNNPAGLAGLDGITFGLSYENRFLMKELSYMNAGLALPEGKAGCFSLTLSRFGFPDFNENKIGIGYARSFGPHLKIGLQIDYLLFKFSNDYKNRNTFTFELGVQSDMTEKLCVGAYIFNPVNVKINSLNNEKIPIIFRIGLSYEITKDFMATAEAEYNSDKALNYRIGLEYNVLKDFFIRAGVYTNPATACFGAGYSLNFFTIDISAKMNQTTGVSLQGDFIFRL